MRYGNNVRLVWWGPQPYQSFMFWLGITEAAHITEERIWTTAADSMHTMSIMVGDLLRIDAQIQNKNVVQLDISWNGRLPPEIGINGFRPKFVEGMSPWGYPWDTAIQADEDHVYYRNSSSVIPLFGIVGFSILLLATIGYALLT